jgi:hypothetical protein
MDDAAMILTAEQWEIVAAEAREHEADTVIAQTQLVDGVPELHVDLYKEDDRWWRLTLEVSRRGTVRQSGPGVRA